MYIYIIRHGETYGNLNGDGFAETDLTPKGEEQVRLLGERFKDKQLHKIYTSPLIRAVKTTKAIAEYHPDTPVVVNWDILEKGTAPDYCGLPFVKIKEHLPSANFDTPTPTGEETDQKAYERAKRFIEKIKSENPFDSRIAVIAHGTFNSFLVLAALGFSLKDNFNFSHLNTGVSLVCYIKENDIIKTKLKYLNNTAHLGIDDEY